MQKMQSNRAVRMRMMSRGFLVMLALVFILPLVPYAHAYLGGLSVPNKGSDLWREVRQREQPSQFHSQARGQEASVLINAEGQQWRELRLRQLIPYGGYLMGAVLLAILLFYLLRGRIRIEAGRSGRLVPRFSQLQRWVHWVVAGLFVIMAATGLALLYGRLVLIPLLGAEGFQATAALGKLLHNYLGPLFGISVVAMILVFLKGNGFKLVDLKWFLKGGGLIGGHASAGRYNGGEKIWYWVVVLFGLAVVITGLMLDFPLLDLSRADLGLTQVIHAIVALLLIAGFLGHTYIATLGMEGAIDSMKSGYVDENWAKEHHDLWYDEMLEQGLVGVDPDQNDKPSPPAAEPARQ